MKSRNKKQGGAYRYYKQRSSMHAKKGRNRNTAAGKRPKPELEHEGWKAVQNTVKQIVTVYTPDGIPFTDFMVEKKLKDFELRGYIEYCIKVSRMREGESLCD